MSARSLDQYRDQRPKSGSAGRNGLRWVGQFMALVTTADGERKLVGTWWDPDSATDWAVTIGAERPGWKAEIFELEFKDYWLPFKRKDEEVNVTSPAI